MNIIYLVPALGVLGLIVMAIKSAWVSKQDAGDKNMQEIYFELYYSQHLSLNN